MNTMNRRSFLAKAGLVTAGATTAGFLPHTAPAEDKGSAASGNADPNPNGAVDLGQTFKAAPKDHGGALINPDMGWTLHYYSNIPAHYGSKLAPSDTVDEFPGMSTIYMRLPWAFIEPEEGKFDWEILDTPGPTMDRSRQESGISDHVDGELDAEGDTAVGVRRGSKFIRGR
jgi:hypothetical protein